MTNGEKLKEVFPDIEFTEMAYTVHAVAGVTSNGVKGHISYDFWKEWWNTEYKEPTTKNNLEVDCVSRKDVHDMLENLPITVEDRWFNWLQKACMRLADLPPVTPQEPRIDFEELKRKILMEVDDGTDDAWLAYGEVCDRISNSIDEFVTDMREVEE